MLTTTASLQSLCQRLAREPFITIDTEFLRESTFWPQLCLVQVAGANEHALIDPLAEGIDLAPLFELLANEAVLKVFHAGRQDVEIFHYLTGTIPAPIFDTQIAAMVCGYGDQVGYDQIVRQTIGASIDKSHRFTDWSRRPLNDAQLAYAAADVTHLRNVYLYLRNILDTKGRGAWVEEELAVLTDPSTYAVDPEDAWERLKLRARKPIEFAALKAAAKWREETAQARDVPRRRILKDDALYELAQQRPQKLDALTRLRAVPRGFEKQPHAKGLIEAMQHVAALPQDKLPKLPRQKRNPESAPAVADLLKVALKLVAEREGVAPRIIANADDLEAIAIHGDCDVKAMKGWRRELFGEMALAIRSGEKALGVRGKAAVLVPMDADD
ncbi:MAG: ribonuclease D [Devosiaceae bacterium]|nr:ribonuclease D [Devosiaceae bacterium MH13]